MAELICDFCSGPLDLSTATTFPGGDIDLGVSPGATVVKLRPEGMTEETRDLAYHSAGGWTACTTCAPEVSTKHPHRVARLVAKTIAPTMPGVPRRILVRELVKFYTRLLPALGEGRPYRATAMDGRTIYQDEDVVAEAQFQNPEEN